MEHSYGFNIDIDFLRNQPQGSNEQSTWGYIPSERSYWTNDSNLPS